MSIIYANISIIVPRIKLLSEITPISYKILLFQFRKQDFMNDDLNLKTSVISHTSLHLIYIIIDL